MHYIRLLRPATLTGNTLKLILTITTDLGDAFLSPSEPVELCVLGAPTQQDGRPYVFQPPQRLLWRTGLRVLKLELAMPSQAIRTIQIRPLRRELVVLSTKDVLEERPEGLILPAFADLEPTDHVLFRSMQLGPGRPPLQIEEQMGESIARHIWDAGIVATALVADLCLGDGTYNHMSILQAILNQREKCLHILELGCGVGILGTGIAQAFSRPVSVLMTDLPEAEARTVANIARFRRHQSSGGQDGASLDYENLDWEKGRRGVFGAQVAARAWDLIVLSDCIYNVDVLPALVETLTALHVHSAGLAGCGKAQAMKILMATRPRHHSEEALFRLMQEGGWAVEERKTVGMPVLEGEDHRVEMYLFGRA